MAQGGLRDEEVGLGWMLRLSATLPGVKQAGNGGGGI